MRTHPTSRQHFLAMGSLGVGLVVWLLTIVTGPRLGETPSNAPQPSDQQAVRLSELPPAYAEMVYWAVGLFQRAELELPELEISYVGLDAKGCDWRLGGHRRVGDLSQITLCETPNLHIREHLVLHEIAHAYLEHHLAPNRKARFKSLRGWTEWWNYDAAPWHENGAEQAAEILVWGLIDRPVGIVRIYQNTCAELDAGYRILTGRPPLNGFNDFCDG
ncbi:MAG: hypothetical protein HKN03_11055 [Acidimicrobiales bacterium]|nr:hypothetical protein [Acidimicrobiales bacterium]